MNETLIAAILSKTGIKLIQGLPTMSTKAISIDELAEKTGITPVTAYRVMSVLSEWSNIISYQVDSTHAPLGLYYIESKLFTVTITKDNVRVDVI